MRCQIASKHKTDDLSLRLDSEDFTFGGLDQLSFIGPNRIFTAEKSIITYKAGTIRAEKQREVRDKIVS